MAAAPSSSVQVGGVEAAEAVRGSAFETLRRTQRRFVWPVTAVFLGTYLATVWLAAYRPEAMALPGLGELTRGVLVVLANFAVTFAVTLLYRRYANSTLDRLGRKAAEEGPVVATAEVQGR
jgi:uncharacterized membrane protein (DUF485 family)